MSASRLRVQIALTGSLSGILPGGKSESYITYVIYLSMHRIEGDIGNLLEDHRSGIPSSLDPKATVSYKFPVLENLTLDGLDDNLAKVLMRLPGVSLKSLVFRTLEPIIWHPFFEEDGEAEEEMQFSIYIPHATHIMQPLDIYLGC